MQSFPLVGVAAGLQNPAAFRACSEGPSLEKTEAMLAVVKQTFEGHEHFHSQPQSCFNMPSLYFGPGFEQIVSRREPFEPGHQRCGLGWAHRKAGHCGGRIAGGSDRNWA